MNSPRASRLPARTERRRSRVERPVPRFTLSVRASTPAAKWRIIPNMESRRLGRFLLSLGRSVNVQTLHSITQGVPAYLQLFRRAADAESILLEGMQDQFP